MTPNWKADGSDSLFLAYEPWTPDSSPFLKHAKQLGVAFPSSLPLESLAARGWMLPRLRVALPPAAIRACWNASCDPTDSPDHDPEHAWAHQLLAQCRTRSVDQLPSDAPWKHWLESEKSGLGRSARAHVVDPSNGRAEPPSMQHPRQEKNVLPVADFYAEWQVYQLAELLDRAELRDLVVTSEGDACIQACRKLAGDFDRHVQQTRERWKHFAPALERLARFRTLWASHARETADFDRLMERDSRAWAVDERFDASTVRADIRDRLLELWAEWREKPPLNSNHLLLGLQRDIGLATTLLGYLSGEPPSPFDPDWFWLDWERPGLCAARLIDALPNEEWRAPIAFTKNASSRAAKHPQPFASSKADLWTVVRGHWETCAPLRRFCLAWTRLMSSRLHDQHRLAEQTIAANERIEQFNLVGLHTERVLRYVAAKLTPSTTSKQETSEWVMRESAQRSLSHLPVPVTVPDQLIADLIKKHTRLHTMPDVAQSLCLPTSVASGSDAANQLVAAHVNALIARNYAAHHDYFDDKMIGAPGASLLSSCLLVAIAALHSLPPKNAATP